MSQFIADVFCIKTGHDLFLTLTKCCQYLNITMKKLNNVVISTSA